MRHYLYSIFLLVFPVILNAHPSYGIVINDRGEIIFCDVLHNEGTLWKIDKQGTLHKLLTHEHCHFIQQDPDGTIWGTQHEYLPRTETNRNSLWKYKDGVKTIVIQPTEDPRAFSGTNFVVIGEQIFYDYERQLYRRTANGTPELFVQDNFGRITSLQRDIHGNVYIISHSTHGGSVYQVTLDRDVSVVARNLREDKPEDPPFERDMHNMLFAAFVRDDGTIFVANNGSRRVSRIKPDGTTDHIYHSQRPWYPVAYTECNGTALVMEMGFSQTNIGPRIIDVSEGKSELIMDVDNPVGNSQGSVRPSQDMKRYRPLKYAGMFGILLLVLSVVMLKRVR